MVHVVKYQNPSPTLPVLQPITHKLKDDTLRILSSGYLDEVGDLAEALLVARCVACMHPEYPGLWLLLSNLIRVFDGDL